jgi:hypothetical protein
MKPTSPKKNHKNRQRGIALTLVLIAVTMASILSMTFITSQSTSIGVAQSVTAYTTARNLAESGIETALAYIVTNHDWRSAQTHGVWTGRHAFAGGNYRLLFEDDADADLADNGSDPVTITAASNYGGASHEVTIVVHLGTSDPLASVSIFGDITMDQGTTIDSFDSRLGGYDPDDPGTDATIATNTINSSGVTVGVGVAGSDPPATIEGNLDVGPNGDTATVVDGSGTITGTTDNLDSQLVVPKIIVPDDSIVGASLGNKRLDSAILSTSRHYNNLKLRNSLTIIGDVEIVCDGEFAMEAGTTVDITAGSSLKVYVFGNIDIQKSSTSAGFSDPASFILFGVGEGNGQGIVYDKQSEMYVTIVAPEWDVNIKMESQLYGTVIAETLNMERLTEIHADSSPNLTADEIGLPTHTPRNIVWSETP